MKASGRDAGRATNISRQPGQGVPSPSLPLSAAGRQAGPGPGWDRETTRRGDRRAAGRGAVLGHGHGCVAEAELTDASSPSAPADRARSLTAGCQGRRPVFSPYSPSDRASAIFGHAGVNRPRSFVGRKTGAACARAHTPRRGSPVCRATAAGMWCGGSVALALLEPGEGQDVAADGTGVARGFRVRLSWSRRWMAQRTWPPERERRLNRPPISACCGLAEGQANSDGFQQLKDSDQGFGRGRGGPGIPYGFGETGGDHSRRSTTLLPSAPCAFLGGSVPEMRTTGEEDSDAYEMVGDAAELTRNGRAAVTENNRGHG
ncbi:hypothetical protein FBY35_4027 [Streptomyces sp. SLBN-118]|nr:hypothetical protein FBY35_4027 [Streptomyces sp. SLBN-118]